MDRIPIKNIILKICEKLRGYSGDTEYFEVVGVTENETDPDIYEVTVRVVKQEAADENNE